MSERHVGNRVTTETRYYIVSFADDAVQFARAVRRHWSVENELHWVLEVTFNEDNSRIRSRHGPENFAVVRHIALNLLKQKGGKASMAKKRYRAALNDGFRSQVLL